MPSQQGSHGRASSGNSGVTLGSKPEVHLGAGAATMIKQKGNMAEAAPSSPAQVTETAGQSSTAAAVELQDYPSHGAGQYPQEAEHQAQIADLQVSSATFIGCAVCSWLVAIYIVSSFASQGPLSAMST